MQTERRLPELSGTVLWLIPSRAEVAVFQREIVRLSAYFGTCCFSPHLTLGRLPADKISDEDLLKVKKEPDLGFTNRPVGDFDSLECSTTPYQNLFASLKPSAALNRAQQQLKVLISGYIPKKEYHISLLYGNVPCDEMQGEKERISVILPEKIRFSSLRMIHLNGGPDSWTTLWERSIHVP